MRFETTLKTLVDFFEREDIRYAVTGQLALHAYEVRHVWPRIEFAVATSARERVIEHMSSLGYCTTYASPRCSLHTNEDTSFGKVAFIYTELRFDSIPAPLCNLSLVSIANPAVRFALTEADVLALDTATMQLDTHAWLDWVTALSAHLRPSNKTNSDSDEPFVL